MTWHSVLIYFALVFVISWGGGFLVLGPGGFPLDAAEFENQGALLYATNLAGPVVAGLLLTAIVEGRLGIHGLFARLRRWRVGWRWYALALLPAVVAAATALLPALVFDDFRPSILDADDKAGLLLRALVPALLVGSLEEIGWTGFAVPQLRARYSILTTGLAVGIVWGAWHFPLFWARDSFAAALPLAILLTQLFSWLPPFRVLLVWVHDRTHSLPVVMLMHAAVSFVAIALAPETLTGTRLLTSLVVSAAAMWLLLAVVGWVNRPTLRLAPPPRSRTSTSAAVPAAARHPASTTRSP